MGDLLIRDLPAGTHAELKRRAEQAGMSLQAYVTQMLARSTSTPTLSDWLQGLEDLPRHADVSGADAVREARDELP
jgi:plasmid stability protein